MSDRYQLDPEKPEYIPAPPIPRWFQEELERLLPRNLFGDPALRAVWMMDAKCFRNGNPEDIKYIALHEKIVTRKWRRLDPVEGKFEYFNTRDEAVKAVNIRLLPTLEYKVLRENRHWGVPRWQIELWLQIKDSAAGWERNRYRRVRDRQGNFFTLDTIGPYPTRGQYRGVMTVENVDGSYRGLDRPLIEEIRALLRTNEEATHNDYTNARELSEQYAEAAATEAALEHRIEEEFMEDHLGPSKYRLIEGNKFKGFRAPTDALRRPILK